MGMTKTQFEWHMNRLVGVYGDRAYPSARIEIFWKELKHVDVELWDASVDSLISENQHPPMLEKIRVCISYLREKFDRPDILKEKIARAPNCLLCSKTGAVVATARKDFSIFAFRCSCLCGELRHFNYPMWETADHSLFYEPTDASWYVALKERWKIKPNMSENQKAELVRSMIEGIAKPMPQDIYET